MRKNRLGSSDLLVSEIGLGCMSLGRDHVANAALLHRAVELGINFFDTADLYHHGENEATVGRALHDRRQRVLIATKVGNRRRETGGWDWAPSGGYIKQAVHDSLRRLRTDYIDLYQLHGGNIDDPIDDCVAAFEDLLRAGIIRAYGISSVRPDAIREYATRSGLASVMLQYSLIDRRPEDSVFRFLHQNDVGVICRGVVGKGLLAGKPAIDYHGHSLAEIEMVQQVLKTFERPDRTLAQAAIRFCLAEPAVATVIPGASNLAQLAENGGASGASPLSNKEVAELKRLTKAMRL